MEPSLLLQVGVLAVAFVGAFAVAKWRVDQAEIRLTKLEEAFHRYQLEVAEKYVSGTNFAKFETEIKEGINRLTSRLDQVLARRRT